MQSVLTKMIFILVTVALLVGGALAAVNSFARPLIIANQEKKIRSAVFAVLPGAVDFTEIAAGDVSYFKGVDGSGEAVGVAMLARGNGWGSEIVLMAGLDRSLEKLTGLVILEQRETPGLGNKIAEPDFQDQFDGLTFSPEIVLLRNETAEQENEVEAVTGATISSRAVVTILNSSLGGVDEVFPAGVD